MFKSKIKNFYSITIILMLASCSANYKSINHKIDLGNQVSARSIDAKQRLVYSYPRKNNNGNLVVCSEPSPDVFSVYASALAANATKGEDLKAAFEFTSSETGGAIGLRTESIQLLRDAMYRLCEAYAAGGLNQQQYNSLLSKYQKSMVTLIAIANLTGSALPSQIVLSNTSSIAMNSDLFKAKEQLDKAQKDVAEIEKKITAKEKEKKTVEEALGDDLAKCTDDSVTTKPEKCAELKTVNAAISQLETQKKGLDEELAESKKVFNEIQSNVSLTTQAKIEAIKASRSNITFESVQKISDTVKELVKDVFNEDARQACVNKISSLNFGEFESIKLIGVNALPSVKDVNKTMTISALDQKYFNEIVTLQRENRSLSSDTKSPLTDASKTTLEQNNQKIEQLSKNKSQLALAVAEFCEGFSG